MAHLNWSYSSREPKDRLVVAIAVRDSDLRPLMRVAQAAVTAGDQTPARG